MSWELMNTYKHPCQCGKGFVVVENYMDDWNRTEEKNYIHCEDCNNRMIEKQNQEKEINNEIAAIVDYFNEKYLDQWVDYFSDKKNKKVIWETVHNMGVESYSLTSFYSHQRSTSMDAMRGYYKNLVNIQSMKTIMQVLNIKDETIEVTLPKLIDFDNDRRRRILNEMYSRY